MSSTTVYFRGSRDEARRIIRGLGPILSGRSPDPLGIAQGVFLAVGFAVLSDVKADFVRKSRGETGEDGVKWPPLSPAYLAYGRRFGRGEQTALKKAAGLGGTHRYAPGGAKGLLTAEQLKRWRQVYSRVLHRLMLSMHAEKWSLDTDAEIQASRFTTGEGGAKSKAAAIAWATVKAEGAKTKLEVYGHRKVDILRDTGILLNSLSPGQLEGGDYRPPTAEGGEQQIMRTIGNGVVVGTSVPYAGVHQHGSQKHGIPARPFLPERVPDVWAARWAEAATLALAAGMRLALGAAA